MPTTTSYGNWTNYASSISIEETVEDFLADYVITFKEAGVFNAIVDDFRGAINAELPGGVTLNGNQFYGPYPLADNVRPDDLNTLIPDVIEAVDLSAIVERHDPDNE